MNCCLLVDVCYRPDNIQGWNLYNEGYPWGQKKFGNHSLANCCSNVTVQSEVPNFHKCRNPDIGWPTHVPWTAKLKDSKNTQMLVNNRTAIIDIRHTLAIVCKYKEGYKCVVHWPASHLLPVKPYTQAQRSGPIHRPPLEQPSPQIAESEQHANVS